MKRRKRRNASTVVLLLNLRGGSDSAHSVTGPFLSAGPDEVLLLDLALFALRHGASRVEAFRISEA